MLTVFHFIFLRTSASHVLEPTEIRKKIVSEDGGLICAPQDIHERMQLATSSLIHSSAPSLHTQLTEDLSGAVMWVTEWISLRTDRDFFTPRGSNSGA